MNQNIPTIKQELNRRFSLSLKEVKWHNGLKETIIIFPAIYDYLAFIEATPLLTGLIAEDLYNAKIQALNNEVTATEDQLKKLQQKHFNSETTLELTKNKFLSASRAKKEFLERDDNKKRGVLGNILWNLTIENKNLASFKLKDPYQRMAEVSKNCSFAELSG